MGFITRERLEHRKRKRAIQIHDQTKSTAHSQNPYWSGVHDCLSFGVLQCNELPACLLDLNDEEV